jgi:maleate cis-trans isomerase
VSGPVAEGAVARIGILYPIGGAEHEYYRLAEETGYAFRPFLVGARIFGDGHDHDLEHLRQTAAISNLLEAAEGLVPLKPDAVMWACTSGSFVDGRAHAEAQAAALSRKLGCLASSTSLAFAAAAQALGLKRVAVLASYPEPAARAFAGFLEEFGVTVQDLAWLDAPAGPDAARFGEDRLISAASKLSLAGADGLLVPDTAIAAFELVRRLEAKLDRPVLAANPVTIWQALRLARKFNPGAGFGHLFSV